MRQFISTSSKNVYVTNLLEVSVLAGDNEQRNIVVNIMKMVVIDTIDVVSDAEQSYNYS